MTSTVIPTRMGNEESKLVAAVIAREREHAIASAKLFAARNRLKRFYEAQTE